MDLSKQEIINLIQSGESLVVEFKGDWEGRNRSSNGLPDRELVAAVVSLANTRGGYLLLGVEDNGEITGLRPRHQDVIGMAAMIANKTNPALSVESSICDIGDEKIAVIQVPNSSQLVSTSDGLLLKRRLQVDGKPEAVPFYPHEFISRQSSFGLIDPSAVVLTDIAVKATPAVRQNFRRRTKHIEQPLFRQARLFPCSQIHPAIIRRNNFKQRNIIFCSDCCKLPGKIFPRKFPVPDTVCRSPCRLICKFHQIPDLTFRIMPHLLNGALHKINRIAVAEKPGSFSGIFHGVSAVTNNKKQR